MSKVEDTTVSAGACLYKMTHLGGRAKTTVRVHNLGVNLAVGTSCPEVDGSEGRS